MADTTIIYRDIAPGSREDSTLAMSDLQIFCNLSDVKTGETVPATATCETDYWRLNGSFDIMPDNRVGHWGAWSKSMSGADGRFATPPVLTITFAEQHSSVGITFSFDQNGPDWCNDLNIKWYRGTALLADKDFQPSAWQSVCLYEVRNYNKLVVTFRSMAKPNRYLKLQDVIYGITREFGQSELRALNLFQSASIISEQLEIDTMEFVLSSDDPVPFMFQRKQTLELYHSGNLQGVFYIADSKRTASSVYDISSSCQIALLEEGSNHVGGVYNGTTFGSLVAEIMGTQPYEIESALVSIPIYGWLPIASRRDNLAQAAFAVGAVVSTAGSKYARIFRPPSNAPVAFDGERVFANSHIETSALVTGVEVTEHTYKATNESQELFNDTLNGTAEITFSEPMLSLTITGGTIVKSATNYAVISGTGGTVVLSGKNYAHTTKLVRVSKPTITAVDILNVVQVQDATLVSSYNSATVAQRVYDYYQKRERVNASLVLSNEMPGDKVTVTTEFDGIRTGTILSLDTDLARKRYGEAVILCD